MVHNAEAPSITPAAAVAIAPPLQQAVPLIKPQRLTADSAGRRLCAVFIPNKKVNCGSFDAPFAGGGTARREKRAESVFRNPTRTTKASRASWLSTAAPTPTSVSAAVTVIAATKLFPRLLFTRENAALSSPLTGCSAAISLER
ncbi:hypothetical protein MTO96_003203 [Rhipicephalus appendiculatus]